MRAKAEKRVKPSKSMAAKIREAGRRAARLYCPAYRGTTCNMLPCWECSMRSYGRDCQNNPIGSREAVIAAARAAVVELPIARENKQGTEGEVGERKGACA